VLLKGILTLETYVSDGVALIKQALENALKTSPAVTITYAGGGNYHMTVRHRNSRKPRRYSRTRQRPRWLLSRKVKGKAEFKREETA